MHVMSQCPGTMIQPDNSYFRLQHFGVIGHKSVLISVIKNSNNHTFFH